MGLKEISPSPAVQLVFSLCQWKRKSQFSLCLRKWKIWVSHYGKMALTLQKQFIQQNFQLPTPKVWVCGSPCVNRNRKFGSAITKKWKNSPNSAKTCHTEKFPITDPPKVWVSGSPCVNKNGKFRSAIMKKWKNGPNSAQARWTAKFPITDPPKVWVSGSPCINGSRKFGSAMMKKWKNCPNSAKTCHTTKFQITDPLKVWSPVLLVSMKIENWCQPLWKSGKMALIVQKLIKEQNFQLLNPINHQTLTQISTPPLSKPHTKPPCHAQLPIPTTMTPSHLSKLTAITSPTTFTPWQSIVSILC